MNDKREIKRCIVITGMSGAGKSTALNVFEDQGFYAIDNLPPALLPQLMEVLASHPAALNYGVAAVVDARGKELLNDLNYVVARLRGMGIDAEVVFINASDEALVRRFETTRRRHPLAEGNTIMQGIMEERETLSAIIKKADIVIDTSNFTLPEFKSKVLEATGVTLAEPSVIVSSFGFKYGAPQDADYIFDVRFLPNPNYVDDLHMLSGMDDAVKNYLNGFDSLKKFLDLSLPLLVYISSVYCKTGKKQLHICFGCTGGRHRSVAVAEIAGRAIAGSGKQVLITHRDIDKGGAR